MGLPDNRILAASMLVVASLSLGCENNETNDTTTFLKCQVQELAKCWSKEEMSESIQGNTEVLQSARARNRSLSITTKLRRDTNRVCGIIFSREQKANKELLSAFSLFCDAKYATNFDLLGFAREGNDSRHDRSGLLPARKQLEKYWTETPATHRSPVAGEILAILYEDLGFWQKARDLYRDLIALGESTSLSRKAVTNFRLGLANSEYELGRLSHAAQGFLDIVAPLFGQRNCLLMGEEDTRGTHAFYDVPSEVDEEFTMALYGLYWSLSRMGLITEADLIASLGKFHTRYFGWHTVERYLFELDRESGVLERKAPFWLPNVQCVCKGKLDPLLSPSE